jgi:hypothetical protein
MSTFWTAFSPDFTRNPQLNYSEEFKRLAVHRRWKVGGARYRKAWVRCCEEEFGVQYGRDERRLDGWRALCADVGIEDIPNSITQCKKVCLNRFSGIGPKDECRYVLLTSLGLQVLNRTWVNLVHLIECRANGTVAFRHPSQNALRIYTKETGKIFPKKAAKENGFLKALLITIY